MPDLEERREDLRQERISREVESALANTTSLRQQATDLRRKVKEVEDHWRNLPERRKEKR